ncbi:hypothetical protein AA15669_1984 [Saccharibacter floricola DSM 15669]|uniref:Uncharacterized protein n=1 Tax=Saccharibacter floricola DSM 15669 TaxID=1123227 RepID=A0ABQ0P267_9PROT|nr:hypothetical protein AA15669_1984 [Saccharibacter floricola DSM 15669]
MSAVPPSSTHNRESHVVAMHNVTLARSAYAKTIHLPSFHMRGREHASRGGFPMTGVLSSAHVLRHKERTL